MKIWFTGKLNGEEFMSSTSYPQLEVHCLKITNEDKTRTLFQLTDQEMATYENNLRINEELRGILNEGWKNIQNEIKNFDPKNH